MALDEIYHLIYAPIPRSVTLRASTVHGGLQAKHRILTWAHALFQEAFAQAADSATSVGYNPGPGHLLERNCEWLIKAVIVYLMVAATWITVVILELIHASKPDFAEGLCLLDT